MAATSAYKPRYAIAYHAKTKVWPYKDSYLRRFFEIRARRRKRGGLFRRNVLVAKTRKWTTARRYIRPFRRAAGKKPSGSGNKAFGRPRKRLYSNLFYLKQQLRYFHGKRKEKSFQQIFKNNRQVVGKNSVSFFNALESRLDRVFFRRRILPTIYACHQYIHHHGLIVNGNKECSPRALIRTGDVLEIPDSTWKPFYWHFFCRVYYRRWGLYILRRRLFTRIKKKTFLFKGKSHIFRKRKRNKSYSDKWNKRNKWSYRNKFQHKNFKKRWVKPSDILAKLTNNPWTNFDWRNKSGIVSYSQRFTPVQQVTYVKKSKKAKRLSYWLAKSQSEDIHELTQTSHNTSEEQQDLTSSAKATDNEAIRSTSGVSVNKSNVSYTKKKVHKRKGNFAKRIKSRYSRVVAFNSSVVKYIAADLRSTNKKSLSVASKATQTSQNRSKVSKRIKLSQVLSVASKATATSHNPIDQRSVISQNTWVARRVAKWVANKVTQRAIRKSIRIGRKFINTKGFQNTTVPVGLTQTSHVSQAKQLQKLLNISKQQFVSKSVSYPLEIKQLLHKIQANFFTEDLVGTTNISGTTSDVESLVPVTYTNVDTYIAPLDQRSESITNTQSQKSIYNYLIRLLASLYNINFVAPVDGEVSTGQVEESNAQVNARSDRRSSAATKAGDVAVVDISSSTKATTFVEDPKRHTLLRKLNWLQKYAITARLRKKHLPSILRKYKRYITSPFTKGHASEAQQKGWQRGNKKWRSLRNKQRRLRKKWRRKDIRRRKIPRLKAVHRYFPSHLHVDLRTLRAVKIESATQDKIYHPFRGSVAKVQSYYRSRGF